MMGRASGRLRSCQSLPPNGGPRLQASDEVRRQIDRAYLSLIIGAVRGNLHCQCNSGSTSKGKGEVCSTRNGALWSMLAHAFA